MPIMNRQVHLVSRPTGSPSLDNFRVVKQPLPDIGPRQVLVRNHYLSLDPYMRGRMNARKSYAPPQPLNDVMIGGTVGEVVATTVDRFRRGDKVLTMGGWQEYLLVDEAQLTDTNAAQRVSLTKVDAGQAPLSAYLGIVGMPGVAAWVGLTQICTPRHDETVVVSSAAGAVGGVVGQLAKTRGCRVVGIAGGEEKRRYVEEELGFDVCIDYRQYTNFDSFAAALAVAAPRGIDCYFENVGGEILDAVMPAMNDFGRIALCGLIAGYSGESIPIFNPEIILTKRLKLQGFIVSDHMDLWMAALEELKMLLAAGRLFYHESVSQGLESAPHAFMDMLKGRSFGKHLVKLV